MEKNTLIYILKQSLFYRKAMEPKWLLNSKKIDSLSLAYYRASFWCTEEDKHWPLHWDTSGAVLLSHSFPDSTQPQCCTWSKQPTRETKPAVCKKNQPTKSYNQNYGNWLR